MCTATHSEIQWEWLHWKKAMPDSGSQWAWQNIFDIFLFSVFVMLSVGVTVCLCLCTDKYIILIYVGYESSVDWSKPWMFDTSPTYLTTKDETITWLQSNTISELLPYPHRRNIWYDISKIYRVSLLSCPRVQQLYRIKKPASAGTSRDSCCTQGHATIETLYLSRKTSFLLSLTFWRRNYFFNFSTPVYKMWIIQESNTLELWNKLHFEEKKNGEYIPCLKYAVPIFVE